MASCARGLPGLPADGDFLLGTARALLLALCVLAADFGFHVRASSAQMPSASAGSIERGAALFDDHLTHRSADAERVKRTGSIERAPGWFDYQVSVDHEGWYEFLLAGRGSEGQYSIRRQGSVEPDVALISGSSGFDGKADKLGNVWLDAGAYTVRIANEFWNPSGPITGFLLRPGSARAGTRLSVEGASPRRIMRRRACEPLLIRHGPEAAASSLAFELRDTAVNATLQRGHIDLPATAEVATTRWLPPCDRAGMFELSFADPAKGTQSRDLQRYRYQVFDTRALPTATSSDAVRKLIHSLDLVKTDPDYSDGSSRVTTSTAGTYRESGSRGFQSWQIDPKRTGEPSWFAYALPELVPQKLYQVEIDYPDDAERTFAIVLREENVENYPVAGGVDSGGEFRLTHANQTQTLLIWPRGRHVRVLFMPSREGTRAAASAIRVYEVDEALPPLVEASAPGRRFGQWYEEGTNFTAMFGAPDRSPRSLRTAVERWTATAAHMGIGTLIPTVVVYESAMYPSKFNRAFSRYPGEGDMLRQILLSAEHRGLEVIPEVHPRADELLFPFQHEAPPRQNQLISKAGQVVANLPTFYNPLHPFNQDWYVGMVGEIADNYRDSPALKGISLRLMGWRSPTLHNFHSLDWGYDDHTIAQFTRDTGLQIPLSGDPARRFSERHAWLMANAGEAWIDWRCRQVTALITRIRDRVRAARPDLVVQIPIFPITTIGDRYFAGTDWIREAGIDVKMLSQVEGVVLVNALHLYGRRWDAGRNARLRENLVGRPARALVGDGGPGAHFLPTAVYFEALQFVVTPEQLGFAKGSRRTYTSAVVNPAGRNYLERFAVLLADTDAISLGDGGNAYTIGQPALREFLQEYRRLPPVPFITRSAPDSRVVLRELVRESDRIFYIVNKSALRAALRIELDGAQSVSRLSSGAAVPLVSGVLTQTLEPFQLLAYRMVSGRIIQVRSTATQ